MGKLFGYIFSGLGILVLILSFNLARFGISIKQGYVLGIGIVLIAFGVILLMQKSKNKKSTAHQEKEEVPIYQGEGKNRKIVGYRKE